MCSMGCHTYFCTACQNILAVLFIPPFSLKISFDVFGCYAALVCMCGLLELSLNLCLGGGRSL